MYSIPFNLKKILFKKNKPPQLTPEEQALWDQVSQWEQPEFARVGPDDPIVRDAFKIYCYIQEDKIVPWEKVQAIISQEALPFEKVAFEPAPPMNLLVKWALSAAAVLTVFIGGGCLYNGVTPAPSMQVQVNTQEKKDSTVLPDGSLVTLDTTTSLQYSKRLSGKKRSVDLTGEAYFEVRSDSLNPFTVNIGGTKIIARGTAFNINGHADDSTVITLVEGTLLIKTNKQHRTISAGKQATIKNNTIIISTTRDIHKVLEWKPVIVFDGQTLQSVMKQIHQHYKINYTTQPGLSPLRVSGSVSTANSIDKIIKVLNDVNYTMRFEIMNNRIIVSKK
jgi:ferric-dicitrate binding protein FerR (iron transport regulator)